jgi:hypothetical protein
MPSFLPSFRPGIEWIDSMALSPTPLVRTLHGSFPMQSPADATPNLDAMEPAALRAFADRMTATRDIIGNRLGMYARIKARAIQARQEGLIAMALSLESRCDALYRALPGRARW